MNRLYQPERSQSSATTSSSVSLTVVGIGASAGGLSALRQLLSRMPSQSGLAFVVVMHLPAEHQSHLADLLQPHVQMPVRQVTETMAIQANCVYVIPPGCNLSVIDTHLRLSELEARRKDRAPIDHFLRTLASTYEGQAVAVILTGTGADGTLGLKQIRQWGGLTIVQDPWEAEYDGMPQSAIASGQVDLVLPLAEITEAILRFVRTRPRLPLRQEAQALEQGEQPMLHQRMVEQYALPSLLVSPDDNVVHFSEQVGRYLTHPGGELTSLVYRLVRQELRDALQTMLYEVRKQPEVMSSEPITVSLDGKPAPVVMYLRPLQDPYLEGFVLIIFEERRIREPDQDDKGRRVASAEKSALKADGPRSGRIDQPKMDRAISSTYSERLQSINEELRISLEALESSREELQSMNEALQIVNQENLFKVKELAQLSGDLQNLLNATNMATLFLDRDLHILRYTSQLENLFNLRATDQGRSISEITHRLHDDQLLADVRQVLDRPHPLQREVQSQEGMWYLMRVMPYRNEEECVEGVVVTFMEITARKQMEESIRAAKIYAENIVETLHEPLLVLTPDLRVKSANQAFYEHFQVRQENIQDQLVYELGNGQWNIKDLHTLLEEVLPQNNVFNDYEVAHEFEQIGRRVMLLNGRRLDHVQLILLGIRDITQQKQDEEALRQSEKRFRSLFSSIDEAFALCEIVLDTEENPIDFRLLEVNPAFEKATGFSPNEAQGKTARELVPGIEPWWIETFGRVVATGRDIRVENQVAVMNRWFNGYASAQGKGKFVLLFTDVTERKKAEQTLRQREEHLRLIMESATDYAIFTTDVEGNITDWNTGAEYILGYTKEEILGQPVSQLFTPEDRQTEPQHEKQRALKKGHALNERWMVRKDGSLIWLRGTLMPLRSQQESKGFLKIMSDMTKRKSIEENLRKAKEAAEQAARAKEDFLAHMSHEIRTPLNAISGLSTLLLQQNPPAHLLENLETLKFSADNLRLLVNDILDFSKIQAGKVELEETEVYLPDLFYSIRKAHELQAAEQNNRLQVQWDDQLPETVITDQLKLSQILQNLVSNALKFTRNGSVTLSVSLKEENDDQLWVSFSVEDTGVGISKEKQAAIFDAFVQADISTARQYGGTGLGLSITKLLLELMGSKIALESEEGQGARFFFTLPVRKIDRRPENKRSAERTSHEDVSMDDLSILLVEDTVINRVVVKQFLSQWWNLSPDEASNGEEAVEKARQQTYDIILMDLRMPIMDGYEATRQLRRMPQYARTPVLALTADTVSQVTKQADAGLFDEVITKPFDPLDLRQKLIQYAPRRTSQPGNRSAAEPQSPAQPSEATQPAVKETSEQINLRKVEELFDHDQEKIKEVLAGVQQELAVFRDLFPSLVDSADVATVSDHKHQLTMPLDLLGLNNLTAMVEECQHLLEEEAPACEIKKMQQKVEDFMDRVCRSIEQSLPPE